MDCVIYLKSSVVSLIVVIPFTFSDTFTVGYSGDFYVTGLNDRNIGLLWERLVNIHEHGLYLTNE